MNVVKPDGGCLFLDPTLTILQAPASGSVRVRKTAPNATGIVVGLGPGWSLQLRADCVANVHRATSSVINRRTIRLLRAGETDIQVHTHPAHISRSGLGSRIFATLATPPS